MDENISRAAGAAHGQHLGEAEFRAVARSAGRTLRRRTTRYGAVHRDPALAGRVAVPR